MINVVIMLAILCIILGVTVATIGRRKAGGFRMTVLIVIGIWALFLWNTVLTDLLLIEDETLESMMPDHTVADIEAPEGEGDDWDLDVSEVPRLHPDSLGTADLEYDRMPVLETENEVAEYILSSMLNEDMTMEFYMSRNLAGSEKEGEDILDDACTSIMVYYLFGSFDYDDFRVLELDDKEGLYVSLEPAFTDPDLDLEARAEACEYVIKHPVPEEGFSSAEEEKEYARDIHDYLIDKLTYYDIDYDEMQDMDMYEAKQEAYNALAEDENDAVCAGYAKGFALIAQYAGIDCAWVWGSDEGDESHAWNMIYPCDGGDPVLVDVTWDDMDDGSENYDYFYSDPDDGEHDNDELMEDFLDHLHGIL